MAARRSAGLLLWRRSPGGFEVLLGHMGGPLWARRDEHAWSLPKGEYDESEHPLDAARREFAEELGHPAPDGPLLDLGEVRQSGGKVVRAWAVEGDLDATTLAGNVVSEPSEQATNIGASPGERSAVPGSTFEMEWPPRSGRTARFPEIDRACWFDPDAARTRLVTAQATFVDRLAAALDR